VQNLICAISGDTSPPTIRRQPIAFSCAIEKRAQILRHFPRIGPTRKDIRRGLRMLVVGSYLILYEFDARRDEVEIVAIVDGRRELSGLF